MTAFPPWLEGAREQLEARVVREQFPHALLIHGPAGTGRRLLGLWVVGRLLGIDGIDVRAALAGGRRMEPESVPSHPDFRLVQPELMKDKGKGKEKEKERRGILVDQIRELIAFLSLTSHQGGKKVVMISPAQDMASPAANSLLKTLEEPPGNSLIILVAGSLSRLAPTTVSRCHRVRVVTPRARLATGWLRRQDPDVDWRPVLELAGGAPVSALQLTDFPRQAAAMEQDLYALLGKRVTPGEVAGRWSRLDPDICLRWLYLRIGREIREVSGDFEGESGQKLRDWFLQTGVKTLSMERSFGYLRDIDELRRLQGAGLNADLQLTNLLTRWYGGAGL